MNCIILKIGGGFKKIFFKIFNKTKNIQKKFKTILLKVNTFSSVVDNDEESE